MSESKFVVICNGSLLGGSTNKNVFNRDELIAEFNAWSKSTPMMDDEGTVFTVDDLIAYCGNGTAVDIFNKHMAEMGDDFVTVCVEELTL